MKGRPSRRPIRIFVGLIVCFVLGGQVLSTGAAAEPVGMIEEFDVGGWAYSLTPGPGGDVWFSFDRDPVLSGDGAIGRITPRGETTLFRAGLDPGSSPGAMTVGPDGNLWFADDGKRPAIGRITPTGAITEFKVGLAAKSRPGALAVGPDGNVWFTDIGAPPAIGRITPSGEIVEFSAGLNSKSYPEGIAAGPDGNLWFGDSASVLGRISPQGSIAEFGNGSYPSPGSLAGPLAGPDGNLWTASSGSKLGISRVTPLGEIATFSAGLSPRTSLLGPLVAGADGNIWLAARGDTIRRGKTPIVGDPTAIGRIAPGGEISTFSKCLHQGPPYTGPNSIAAGPDGNVWFTNLTTRSLPNIGTPPAIGWITPGGEITELRAGMVYASSPDGIVAGPDGALWFTDRELGSIGRVVPPTAPPNTFIVRPAKPAKRNGATRVPVAVPGPGTLSLEPVGLLSNRNRLTPIQGAPKVTTMVASCGNASLSLRLEGIARARLRRYGGVRLKAKVAFTPRGGSTYEEVVTIGIGLRRR